MTKLSIYSIIAGALIPLAYSPFNIWPIAILSPILLLALIANKSPINAFKLAWFFGLGQFGAGVSWVYISINVFGGTHPLLAAILTFVFIAFLSLYPALQIFLMRKIYKNNYKMQTLIGFPCTYVLAEIFRGWFLTGFPWLIIGNSLIDTPLAGYAPIFGVFGVSFLSLLSSSLIYHSYKSKSDADGKLLIKKSTAIITAIWLVGFTLNYVNWTSPVDNFKANLIQGNVRPDDKFTYSYPLQAAWQIYGTLTKENLDADIIIWPENAITLPLNYSSTLIDKLEDLIKDKDINLITGIPYEVKIDKEHYASMLQLGKQKGIYHKRRLVPFGEYLPMDWLRGLINFFDIPMSTFITGPDNQKSLKFKDYTISPLHCYEVAYPELVRKTSMDTNFIVTISEDGWFGNSIGPHQHLQIARMRSLETGRNMLRATTSGISAFIDSKGKIIKKSNQFEKDVLKGEFKIINGNTPWMYIGIWPIVLFLAFGVIVSIRSVTFYKRSYSMPGKIHS